MKHHTLRCRSRLAVVGIVLSLLASVPSIGQAEDPSPKPAAAEGPDKPTITEQSIYIPYTKLREVFEQQGRGVFLPYEQFQELWRLAQDKSKPPIEPGPPVDALITEALHEAKVAKDVVRVSAQLKVELLTKGWKEIPLRLNQAAITSATIGDRPARILFDAATGYKLLLEKTQDGPELIDVAIEYVKAYAKTPGQNSVTFQAPQAPVSRWRIHIPESGVKVNIQPLIAATEVPARESEDGVESTEDTVVLAFVGAVPTVRLDWTPKAEGATGLEALVSVRTEQQVTLEEGVTRVRTALRYDISRSELAQLVIGVPAHWKIVNVLDANVRQWAVGEANDRQEITVQLFEPARGSQRITVELEQFRDESTQAELILPIVEALNVGRQRGILVVQVAAGLRAETTRHTGLLQIDAGELPSSLAKTVWTFAYRFGTVPFDLRLQIEKVQPRIIADSLIEVHLEPEQLTLEMLNVCTIERAGVFQLELRIPPDYDIRQIRGQDVADGQPVQVDTHARQSDDPSHVVVNLSRKAMGRVALKVWLQKRLNEPDLLSPTGQAADIPIPLPRVVGDPVARAIGRIVVHAPESLRLNPGELKGLRGISFNEAVQSMGSKTEQRFAGARPVLAFAFGEDPANLNLTVERRRPQVTVRQLLVARIDSGVVKYNATFFYDILYSGVKSLRIDIPSALVSDVRNHTPGVERVVMDPAPENLPADYIAWNLTGETEFIGQAKIHLGWERKLEKLDVGKSIKMALPHLRPAEVDRAWGQIVLVKAETMDVRETGESAGVRPIDPQHDLMAGAHVPNAARAFEFHSDWQLQVDVTRYKLEEVKVTSIERAVIQMVATRGGQTSVQALYRMRSARQRLAISLPGSVAFDSEPLRINGRAVALERGEEDQFFVPLVGLNADNAFLLELRYTISDADLQLTPPVFESEPAVQKVYLCVYLPNEWVYLGSRGPWTDELRWRWYPILDRRPVARQSVSQLIHWVSEGIETTGSRADTFQTDGKLYPFSALRPAAPPDGTLRLVTLDEDWLNAIVLILVIGSGLVLLRTRASARWIGAGVFVVVLIALGIFFPTLSRQITDGKLAGAVAIILTLWFVHYVIWVRPNDPDLAARRKAREEAGLAKIRSKARAVIPLASPPTSPPENPPAANKEGGADHD